MSTEQKQGQLLKDPAKEARINEAITLLKQEGYEVWSPAEQQEMQEIYDEDENIFLGDLSKFVSVQDNRTKDENEDEDEDGFQPGPGIPGPSSEDAEDDE